MAPGFNKFNMFCQSANIEYERETINQWHAYRQKLRKKMEDETVDNVDPLKLNWLNIIAMSEGSSTHLQGSTKRDIRSDIDHKPTEEKRDENDDTAKLLRIH